MFIVYMFYDIFWFFVALTQSEFGAADNLHRVLVCDHANEVRLRMNLFRFYKLYAKIVGLFL